jgi:hypothetical protein
MAEVVNLSVSDTTDALYYRITHHEDYTEIAKVASIYSTEALIEHGRALFLQGPKHNGAHFNDLGAILSIVSSLPIKERVQCALDIAENGDSEPLQNIVREFVNQ